MMPVVRTRVPTGPRRSRRVKNITATAKLIIVEAKIVAISITGMIATVRRTIIRSQVAVTLNMTEEELIAGRTCPQ